MSGKIRIISGQWRGRRLAVPQRPGLRPSGDRVRETLFNWLQWEIAGARCLDLFAGTGALGLEAVSRGAAKVVFVERDPRLVAALRTVAADWPGGERMEVVAADALRWLARAHTRFDLVFVDPPFSGQLHGRALAALADNGHLAEGARVYLEQDVTAPPLEPDERFETLRSKNVGRVRLTLLAWEAPAPQ